MISAAMEAAVGDEIDRWVSFPVERSDIRRWALAIYHPDTPPRRFWDEGHAASTRHGGVIAPEEFNPFAWMVAEPAGHRTGYAPGQATIEARLGVPEVATEFMLNGGSEVEYGAPMRPGDVITATTTLAGYEERRGRHGPMLFTRTRVVWENQRNEMVKTSTDLLIRY